MLIKNDSFILIVGNTKEAKDTFKHLQRENNNVSLLGQFVKPEKQYDLILIFSEEYLEEKRKWIELLKNNCTKGGLVTINVDGINLLTIQKVVNLTVIGLNFSYPLGKSPFMEIITTDKNTQDQIQLIERWGREKLFKDPYIVNNGISARAYMLAAMTREAFHLVTEGYAGIDSIDRACRNDAGYYMPFTGNYLYMDLMGTMAYALVMKDLNPELSNANKLPDWFIDKVVKGNEGMKSLVGLYDYKKGDYETWKTIMDDFSKDINKLIIKYKKDYVEG